MEQVETSRIARARTRIDFTRALQMARAMPPAETDGTNQRFETLRELARWLLASPTERLLLWNSWTAHDNSEY